MSNASKEELRDQSETWFEGELKSLQKNRDEKFDDCRYYSKQFSANVQCNKNKEHECLDAEDKVYENKKDKLHEDYDNLLAGIDNNDQSLMDKIYNYCLIVGTAEPDF